MSWLLHSRKRVFFVVIAALLILDLGRSLYARVAYATPSEIWKGEPYDLKLAVWLRQQRQSQCAARRKSLRRALRRLSRQRRRRQRSPRLRSIRARAILN